MQMPSLLGSHIPKASRFVYSIILYAIFYFSLMRVAQDFMPAIVHISLLA
jgi:hypothetical protein